MAYVLAKRNGTFLENIEVFVCDGEDDLASLPAAPAGSTAHCVAEGTDYILGSGGTWEKQPASGGGGGGDTEIESLSVTANGTYTAPTGKAYSPVEVDVPNSYTSADEGKVVDDGALTAQTSLTVTENDTYDTTLVNSVTVNVGGGGGASNIVTGTFKGTTTGAAMDVNIPYTGNGYPIAVLICVTGGSYAVGSTSGTNEYKWHSLIQRYAIGEFVITKSRSATTPTYNSKTAQENYAVTACIYKNNASSATTYTRTSAMNTGAYIAESATSGAAEACTIKNNKTLSVYIASDSYGFAANIEYTYHVIYSA